MFAIKDVESLKNLSTFLTVPLFAAGFTTSKKTILELETPAELLLQVVPEVLYCSLAFVIITVLIVVSMQLSKACFIVFVLLAFIPLTIGLCQIPTLVLHAIKSDILIPQIFWTLGYISLGFAMISMARTGL